MIGGFLGFVISIYSGDENNFKEWYYWLIIPIMAGMGVSFLVYAMKFFYRLFKTETFEGAIDEITAEWRNRGQSVEGEVNIEVEFYLN